MQLLSPDQISRLSPEERLTLIGQLWDSLHETEVSLSGAQRNELERRLSTFDLDRAEAVTWEQLQAELARRPQHYFNNRKTNANKKTIASRRAVIGQCAPPGARSKDFPVTFSTANCSEAMMTMQIVTRTVSGKPTREITAMVTATIARAWCGARIKSHCESVSSFRNDITNATKKGLAARKRTKFAKTISDRERGPTKSLASIREARNKNVAAFANSTRRSRQISSCREPISIIITLPAVMLANVCN